MIEPLKTEKPEQIVVMTQEKKHKNGMEAILSSVAASLLVVIALIYLADINTDFDISLKNLTMNGALIFICSQAFHFVMKAFAQNREWSGKEYEKSRNEAKTAIERLGKSEYSGRINEYCRAHTEETTERVKTAILSPAGISYKDYIEKYIGKNKKELFKAFPEEQLTKNQVRAILHCNREKIKPYDPNFLRGSFLTPKENVEPSGRYKPRRDNKIETVRTAVSGLFLCVFAVNVGGEIVLNWSFATLVICLVKLFVTVMSGIMGYRFGVNNVQTEINLLLTKSSEAEACIEWCKANPKESV